tara:strand:+ start:646 stop:774 length:129 start_codon:yes stop_codon:yes gene_type:complete
MKRRKEMMMGRGNKGAREWRERSGRMGMKESISEGMAIGWGK